MKNLTKDQELKTLKKTQESSDLDLDFSEDYFIDRENRAEIVNNYKKKKCKN